MKETEEEKYNALRSLIAQKNCPTIVYVSRTRRTIQLAEKLTSDGFPAKPFNGKMDSNEKITNQEAFINNQVKIIVATSAFGMGVEKKTSSWLFTMIFPIRLKTMFRKQDVPDGIRACLQSVMFCLMTMIWTSTSCYSTKRSSVSVRFSRYGKRSRI